MKVHELAKKLETSSKELIEKAKAMGIEVTSANSALSEIDEKTLENAVKAKRKKDAETKIVRVASKKKDRYIFEDRYFQETYITLVPHF